MAQADLALINALTLIRKGYCLGVTPCAGRWAYRGCRKSRAAIGSPMAAPQ